MKTDAYEIILDEENKKIKVTFFVGPSGNGEGGIEFLKDIAKTTHSINCSEYNLIINCYKFNYTSPRILHILESCFIFYKKRGFKKIIILIDNDMLHQQFTRICRKIHLPITIINE